MSLHQAANVNPAPEGYVGLSSEWMCTSRRCREPGRRYHYDCWDEGVWYCDCRRCNRSTDLAIAISDNQEPYFGNDERTSCSLCADNTHHVLFVRTQAAQHSRRTA